MSTAQAAPPLIGVTLGFVPLVPISVPCNEEKSRYRGHENGRSPLQKPAHLQENS